MAGMLPGVKCARRRRFHHSSQTPSGSGAAANYGWSRRPTFCLYASESYHRSSASSVAKQRGWQEAGEEKLEEVAREAKERLDRKLRPHLKSNGRRRQVACANQITVGANSTTVLEVEEKGSENKIASLRSGCENTIWKVGEVDECAICLEVFNSGKSKTAFCLPCAHRFHAACLVPWLANHAHCPCCRMEVLRY